MTQWSDYTTGERLKLLRGKEMTQERLAEASGLAVGTIRKAEQGGKVGLPTLMRLAGGLHTDVSVILGEQAPRRAMAGTDRAMLRELSRTVHDTAADVGTDLAPPAPAALAAGLATAWDSYRAGSFAQAGVLAASAVRNAAAALRAAPAGQECAARGMLTDAYRLAAYVANQHGARDLAFAAIGHAQQRAEQAADPLRVAMVASGRAWVYLRDARLDQAQAAAEASFVSIEPTYRDRDPVLLAAYRLGTLGLGPEVTRSRTRESFAEIVEHTLTVHAKPLFAAMCKDGSPLFDAGLVDPDGLRTALRRLETAAYREEGDSQLLEVADLHLAASAFL